MRKKPLKKCRVVTLFVTLALCCLSVGSLSGQGANVGIHFSNNVVSAPVTGYPSIFNSKLHPGLDFSLGFRLNGNDRHQVWSDLDAGLYYHRFFHTGLRLHGSIEYQYRFTNGVSLEAGLILGYLHSFTWYDVFRMNDAGEYEKISKLKGRPQFLGGFKAGASVPILKSSNKGYRLHCGFRTYLQTPFAGEYIPIIPTNSLMIGISKKINLKKATDETR